MCAVTLKPVNSSRFSCYYSVEFDDDAAILTRTRDQFPVKWMLVGPALVAFISFVILLSQWFIIGGTPWTDSGMII